MTALRTLIVDDEPVARRVLRDELEHLRGIEVVAEAENGRAALRELAARRFDLVLLDLQMPGMDGFEVIRRITARGGPGETVPAIVIVTAYDQHALQAFEAGAVDYLLKPVGQARLAAAVERARRLRGPATLERLAELQQLAAPAAGSRRIVGRVGEEYILLPADQILALQAEGSLVWIYTAQRKFLATRTLRALAARLRDCGFQQVHRGALVNVNHVRKLSPLSSHRWLLTLSNNQTLVTSKRLTRAVRELLR